jgi:hypothetical protein
MVSLAGPPTSESLFGVPLMAWPEPPPPPLPNTWMSVATIVAPVFSVPMSWAAPPPSPSVSYQSWRVVVL